MIDVGHRALGLDLIDAHCLKLQVSHRAGRILGQRLVDAKTDLLALNHLAIHQMCFQDFFCNRHAHDIKSLLVFVPDTGVRHTVPCVFPKTQQNGGFHSLLHEENTGFLRAQIVFIK